MSNSPPTADGDNGLKSKQPVPDKNAGEVAQENTKPEEPEQGENNGKKETSMERSAKTDNEAHENQENNSSEKNSSDSFQIDSYKIQDIFCQTANTTNPEYLVSLEGSSIIRTVKVGEDVFHSSKDYQKKLKEFKNSTSPGIIVSNLTSELIEPMSSPISVPCLYMDRIITHRYAYSPNTYLIEPIDEDDEEEFLKDQNEKKEKTVIYFVKWNGMDEESASWETEDTIAGKAPSLFCAANAYDFPRIIENYWRKTKIIDEESDYKKFPETLEPHDLLHDIKLSDAQLEIFNFLVKTISANKTPVVRIPQGIGKTVAITSFLNTAVFKLNENHPTLLICDDTYTWVETLRFASNLYWCEYPEYKGARSIISREEFQGKIGAKFDIIVMTHELLQRAMNAVNKVKWGFIIFDQTNDQFKVPVWVTRLPGHKIYLYDQQNDDYSQIHSSYEVATITGQEYKAYEELIMVPDLNAGLIYDYLYNHLKNYNLELYDNFQVQVFFLQCAYSHQFLVPELKDIIIGRKAKELGSAPTQEDILELSGECSAKFQEVLKITMECTSSKTVCGVIANGFAVLRLLKEFLVHKGVPATLLSSPIPGESFDKTFECGALLMTRNINSSVIENLDISTLVFYDIDEDFQTDLHIQEYLGRCSQVAVKRLITAESAETAIYGHVLNTDEFYAQGMEKEEAEELVRYSIATTSPWSRSKDQKTQTLDVVYPDMITQLYKEFNQIPISSLETSKEFWHHIYSKNDEVPANGDITLNSVRKLVDDVCKFGVFDIKKIAEDMKLSEEVTKSRILMSFSSMLAETNTYDVIYIACYIAKELSAKQVPVTAEEWTELYSQTYEDNNDAKIIQQILSESKVYKSFAKTCQFANDRIAVEAYSQLTEELYPRRYWTDKSDLPTKEQLKEVLKQSSSFWHVRYDDLRREMMVDVNSFATHYKDEKIKDESLALKFCVDIFKWNPKSPEWDENEVLQVIAMLSEYGIPTNKGNDDGEEVLALCNLIRKTPEESVKFCRLMQEEIMKFSLHDVSIVLPNQMTNTEDVIEIVGQNIANQKPNIIAMHAIRNYLAMTEQQRKDNFSGILPDGWTVETDYLLFSFCCQFGMEAANNLPDVDIGETREGIDVFGNYEKLFKATENNSAIVEKRITAIAQSVSPRVSHSSFSDEEPQIPKTTRCGRTAKVTSPPEPTTTNPKAARIKEEIVMKVPEKPPPSVIMVPPEVRLRNHEMSNEEFLQSVREMRIASQNLMNALTEELLPPDFVLQILRENKLSSPNITSLLQMGKLQPNIVYQLLVEHQITNEILNETLTWVLNNKYFTDDVVRNILAIYRYNKQTISQAISNRGMVISDQKQTPPPPPATAPQNPPQIKPPIQYSVIYQQPVVQQMPLQVQQQIQMQQMMLNQNNNKKSKGKAAQPAQPTPQQQQQQAQQPPQMNPALTQQMYYMQYAYAQQQAAVAQQQQAAAQAAAAAQAQQNQAQQNQNKKNQPPPPPLPQPAAALPVRHKRGPKSAAEKAAEKQAQEAAQAAQAAASAGSQGIAVPLKMNAQPSVVPFIPVPLKSDNKSDDTRRGQKIIESTVLDTLFNKLDKIDKDHNKK
ncbi:hypothetical protein TVAG_362760 [Trichomonas vaginalis G3]|uniref:Chromo domain-containing protein n=1 Tax=Trichomonas vaginalis (strain ATCC PRA-98 / G3) TaxID=412133 RepID=A2E653_TRIV3|nr:helicase protein [Trichomonas vaginalis G3]EAY11895.1 hypothetical protein TVAG_362760 [Trichomonas vaginalis G3]KAI5532311.1 helicase protein [Trichomonas vaginalis G3]|eukprot:XP_001324118.1 hypothetical protein [Trichomonas vaginalis G3]